MCPPYLYAFDTSRVFDGGLSPDAPAKLPTLPGWPQQVQYPVSNSPILADLDQDGALEVIVAANHPDSASDAIPGVGLIYAFRANGQVLPGWPVKPQLWQNRDMALDGPIRGSPVAADINGDGRLEVLVSALKSVYVYRSSGQLFTFPTSSTANVWAAPAIADTDKDGRVEVWVGGTLDTDQAHGYLWRFTAADKGFGRLTWPDVPPEFTEYRALPVSARSAEAPNGSSFCRSAPRHVQGAEIFVPASPHTTFPPSVAQRPSSRRYAKADLR